MTFLNIKFLHIFWNIQNYFYMLNSLMYNYFIYHFFWDLFFFLSVLGLEIIFLLTILTSSVKKALTILLLILMIIFNHCQFTKFNIWKGKRFIPASDALVTNFTTINSRDRLSRSGEVREFSGSDIGDTVNEGIATSFRALSVLDDLLDVLGNESTT